MILLDPKSTQPIEKSHDWLYVDEMGVWHTYKILNSVGRFAFADFNGTHVAWIDGFHGFVYDVSSKTTKRLDMPHAARGDILLTDDVIYILDEYATVAKFDLNGNLIWKTDLKSFLGRYVFARNNALAILDGYLYATASYNKRYLFRIDIATGDILAYNSKWANVYWCDGDIVSLYPLGDWIVLREHPAGDAVIFDRETLEPLFIDYHIVNKAIPGKYMGKVLGYINSKMYYATYVPYQVARSTPAYGNINRAAVDETNKTVFDEIEIPILQPSNKQDAYYGGIAYDNILAMRGYNISTVGNYSLIYNPWKVYFEKNADFGYSPINDEVYMIYKINVPSIITMLSIHNTAPVVNIRNQDIEDFYYYHVFVSKDKQNWTEVKNIQNISDLKLSGSVFIKLVWNPESFTMPVLKPIGVMTEQIEIPIISPTISPNPQYNAINIEARYNSPDNYPASRIASPAPNSYRPETFVDMKVQLDRGNGLEDYSGQLNMRVKIYELHGEGKENSESILVEDQAHVITVPSNVRIGASNSLTPANPYTWQGYKIFYNLDIDADFNIMDDTLIATLYRNDVNYIVEEYIDIPKDRINHEARELNVRMVLRKQLIEVLEAIGVYALVYKKKNTGPHCPDCWDEHYGRRTKEQCTTCFNTGYAGGYYSPYGLRLRILSEQLTIAHSDENVVPINQDAVQLLLPVYPMLDREDVIIIPVRGEILRVEQAQLNSNKTQQMVLASTITPADIRYIHFKEILKNQS